MLPVAEWRLPGVRSPARQPDAGGERRVAIPPVGGAGHRRWVLRGVPARGGDLRGRRRRLDRERPPDVLRRAPAAIADFLAPILWHLASLLYITITHIIAPTHYNINRCYTTWVSVVGLDLQGSRCAGWLPPRCSRRGSPPRAPRKRPGGAGRAPRPSSPRLTCNQRGACSATWSERGGSRSGSPGTSAGRPTCRGSAW